MYEWRKISKEQRARILARRRDRFRPWHSPPHYDPAGLACFHLTAACYEHRPILGASPARMAEFEVELTKILSAENGALHAWCLLPDHWHALVRTDGLKELLAKVGRLHGKTSHAWNGEEVCRGRKCWFRCADRRIRSDRHFHVARNYIHDNAVKHGYVEKWEDWPFSSARAYISEKGRDTVWKEWKAYPVLDMGAGWDD